MAGGLAGGCVVNVRLAMLAGAETSFEKGRIGGIVAEQPVSTVVSTGRKETRTACPKPSSGIPLPRGR